MSLECQNMHIKWDARKGRRRKIGSCQNHNVGLQSAEKAAPSQAEEAKSQEANTRANSQEVANVSEGALSSYEKEDVVDREDVLAQLTERDRESTLMC